MRRKLSMASGLLACLLLALTPSVSFGKGVDDARWIAAQEAMTRAAEFLRKRQAADGSWSPQTGPAITAMAMQVMLDRPDIAPTDPAIVSARRYLLAQVREDGGIHSGFLANYNTAIALSALARLPQDPQVAQAIANGQAFLKRLQWDGQRDPVGELVDQAHPYFGGAGYGKHGRPDLSNTQTMLQGLHDSGLEPEDPAFQRALVFINRLQGTPSNDTFGDRIVPDGGFIYATSLNQENIGVPQSMAGEVETMTADGPVSHLRTYGSMTYAGFKSYLYANLSRDDPRVVDAWNWIRRNYTLDRNPGMPPAQDQQGYFYYLMTFSRALAASGETHVVEPDGTKRAWRADLIDALLERQQDDGSWTNPVDRWLEDDPDLVTSYALIALQAALADE